MLSDKIRHTVEVKRTNVRVVVRFNGLVVADTKRPLTVREIGYPLVYYIPEGDVRLECLEASDHRTHCPYKGEASYFTLVVNGRRSENAVWSYAKPKPSVSDLAGHLAFYPDQVESLSVERIDG